MLYAKHDYDVSYFAFNVLEESPFVRMYGNLFSESPSNILGLQERSDGRVCSASCKQRRARMSGRAVIDDIQTVVNETAPMAVVNSGKVFIPWREERPRSDPECGRDSALRQHVVELTPVRLFGSAHYQKGGTGALPL